MSDLSFEISGHSTNISAVAGNNDIVVSGSLDGEVIVWDIQSGEILKKFKDHFEAIDNIVVSSTHIATGGNDGQGFIYEIENLELKYSVNSCPHQSQYRDKKVNCECYIRVALNEDYFSYCYNFGQNQIDLIEIDTLSVVKSFDVTQKDNNLDYPMIDMTETHLGLSDGNVTYVWDIQNKELIYRRGRVTVLGFNLGYPYLVWAGVGLIVFDFIKQEVKNTLKAEVMDANRQINPFYGNYIMYLEYREREYSHLIIYEIEKDEILHRISEKKPSWVFNIMRNYFITTERDNFLVHLWDLQSGVHLKSFGLPKQEVQEKLTQKEKYQQQLDRENWKIEKTVQIMEIIEKIRPGIPLLISRLAELAEIKSEDAEKFVKQIIKKNPSMGEYLPLEQVFIKEKHDYESKSDITRRDRKRTNLMDVFQICQNCGDSQSILIRVCSSCKFNMPFCNICKRGFSTNDDIVYCQDCNNPFHRKHLTAYIQSMGKCPVCKSKITMSFFD